MSGTLSRKYKTSLQATSLEANSFPPRGDTLFFFGRRTSARSFTPSPFDFIFFFQTSLSLQRSSNGVCFDQPAVARRFSARSFLSDNAYLRVLFGWLSRPRRIKSSPNLRAVEWITDSLSTAADGYGGPPFDCATFSSVSAEQQTPWWMMCTLLCV